MRQRTRKFIGMILLLALICGYSLLVMALAASSMWEVNVWLQTLFYIITGLAWVLPAMPIIKWMQKPDSDQGEF